MRVRCTTNIDCCKRFHWPSMMPRVPRVGELIRSASSTAQKYIELEVCRVTWIYDQLEHDWFVEVELHLGLPAPVTSSLHRMGEKNHEREPGQALSVPER